MIPVEVATDVQLLEDDFTGPLTFRGTAESVIDRFSLVIDVIDVGADLRLKILSVENRIVVARYRVHPGEVSKSEWSLVVHGWGSRRSWWGCRCAGLWLILRAGRER